VPLAKGVSFFYFEVLKGQADIDSSFYVENQSLDRHNSSPNVFTLVYACWHLSINLMPLVFTEWPHIQRIRIFVYRDLPCFTDHNPLSWPFWFR